MFINAKTAGCLSLSKHKSVEIPPKEKAPPKETAPLAKKKSAPPSTDSVATEPSADESSKFVKNPVDRPIKTGSKHNSVILNRSGDASVKLAEAPQPTENKMEMFEAYGSHLFAGQVADKYLKKQGLSAEVLKNPSWVKDHADAVANAVFDW